MGKNILGIFDGNDLEGVSALIDKLEESSFDYLKLEGDGVSLVIGKNGAGEATAFTSSLAAEPSAAAQAPSAPTPEAVLKTSAESAGAATPGASATSAAPAASTGAAAVNTDVSAAAQVKSSVPEQEGIFTIKSPSYGLFYSQSEPGAPPYVTVGAVINKDDTIGLMEIMKTFTAITSPVAGEVVAIHINNEETLEPDMPLVSIKVQ